MQTYSKTLHAADYAWIEKQYVERAWYALDGLYRKLDHRHREWEWAIVMKAIRAVGAYSVLDIGGGASIFSPAACMMGCNVVQVDVDNCGECVVEHSNRADKYAIDYATGQHRFSPITFIQGDFVTIPVDGLYDAVCAISVIEHIEKDDLFLCKMCELVSPGGIVALTTDYHESGNPRCSQHIRTYNRQSMERLQGIAASFGFKPLNGGPEWLNAGTSINGYNFASLIMRKD